MIEFLLAASLQFTAPSVNANPLSCESSTIPLTDLSHAHVYATAASASDTLLLMWVDLEGLEGTPVVVDLPALSGTWSFWTVPFDKTGNGKCVSNVVTIEFPIHSVDVPPLVDPPTEWFDLLGRRVSVPTRSGLYFKRVGGRTTQAVYIR